MLTVGASSVYGSDAIAGVVNFIMRKDFEGLQASIDYGISDRQRRPAPGRLRSPSARPARRATSSPASTTTSSTRSRRATATSPRTPPTSTAAAVHRARLQPQSARLHLACRPTTRSRIALGLHQRHPHPRRQRRDHVGDYRCYDGAADCVQLPGRQPDPDAAGTHQRVLPRQLPDDATTSTRSSRSTTTRPRPTSRSRPLPFDARTDAVRDLGRQLLQPVRRRLRPQPDGRRRTVPLPLHVARPARGLQRHHHRPGGRRCRGLPRRYLEVGLRAQLRPHQRWTTRPTATCSTPACAMRWGRRSWIDRRRGQVRHAGRRRSPTARR